MQSSGFGKLILLAASIVITLPALAQNGQDSNNDKDKNKPKPNQGVQGVPGTGAFAGRLVNPQTGLPIDNPSRGPGGVLSPPVNFQGTGTGAIGTAPYNYTGQNNPATPQKAVEYWRRRIVPGLGGYGNGGVTLVIISPSAYYAAPWYYGGYPSYSSYNQQGFSLGAALGGLSFGVNGSSGTTYVGGVNQGYTANGQPVGSYLQSNVQSGLSLGGAPLAGSVLRGGGGGGDYRVANGGVSTGDPSNGGQYVINIGGNIYAGARNGSNRNGARSGNGASGGYYLDNAGREPNVLERDAELRSTIADIENAFTTGNIKPLEKHVQAGATMAVRAADGSQRGIPGSNYLALTKEAMRVMQTASFTLKTLEAANAQGDLLARGRHELKGEGSSTAFNVEFVLHKRGDKWWVTEVGATPAR